ncbi:ABC transporter ATP-binding protein [Microlunatus parietis]|uniref:ABC-type multidrug transport system fused ATPase/permease subunit n=1 Tax=Microlunatus parietis TaxID=682979 RepID=A0A7Y9IBE3_9ACTN|nr:ABC transporter ATP-binding protein [Microlunatus parietis]NYE73722.1 ABC-type multidrug transport system fused ATPase/permease subunit [Microlunatus parietis]
MIKEWGSTARRLWRAYRISLGFGFRAAPGAAAGQLITGVLMAAFGPLLAYGGKLIIDAVAAANLWLGLITGLVIAVLIGLSLLNVFVYVSFVFVVLERARELADRRLMELAGGTDGIAHYERSDYLDQMQRIREDRDGLGTMVNATTGIVRALVGLVASAIMLAAIHPVLLGLLIIAVVSVLVGRRSTDLEIAADEATSEPERRRRHLFAVGTEADTGKELRIFGSVDDLVRRHRAAAAQVNGVRNAAGWRATRLRLLDAAISAAGYIAAVAVVIMLALAGRATPGDVVLAVGLATQLGGMVMVGVAYGTSFVRGLKTADRLLWLEDYAATARHRPADPAPVPDRLDDGITLTDVSFGYPGAPGGRGVLDRVSLKLPAGAVVALVGENGAGKTTLVKLLSGFYRPDAGSIKIDGTDLDRIDPADWRRRVSATFQDFVAFEFLAREAVGIGDLDRIDDRDAVAEAVARADAGPVVADLPDRLDTQLGTAWGGIDLSGGQWQRLALARGLIRPDPLLVILDEPTAALDPQTEHALFERFTAAAGDARSRGGVTLLVSHRFSTVRMADLIIVLDQGRVREVGDHETLIKRGDLYAELYELQSRAYR